MTILIIISIVLLVLFLLWWIFDVNPFRVILEFGAAVIDSIGNGGGDSGDGFGGGDSGGGGASSDW